jgi:hypothetical protein
MRWTLIVNCRLIGVLHEFHRKLNVYEQIRSMNFDPQKFFQPYGFILYPATRPLLTYLLMGEDGPFLPGEIYEKFAGAVAWLDFLLYSWVVVFDGLDLMKLMIRNEDLAKSR